MVLGSLFKRFLNRGDEFAQLVVQSTVDWKVHGSNWLGVCTKSFSNSAVSSIFSMNVMDAMVISEQVHQRLFLFCYDEDKGLNFVLEFNIYPFLDIPNRSWSRELNNHKCFSMKKLEKLVTWIHKLETCLQLGPTLVMIL